MNLTLQKSSIVNRQSKIVITGSKSESNRLLLLQALFPEISIDNLSNSDDTEVMQKALKSTESIIDVHHAGTAMRFLTAYFAVQDGREVVLTGSKRMQERPVKILVEALRSLGASISYVENEGFPPLKIEGKQLTKNKVSLNAGVSSQYLSALLLIAPQLKNGLELTLEGEITSRPYLEMTLALLNETGVQTTFSKSVILVESIRNLQPAIRNPLVVESDWSSASYWYSIVALSEIGTGISLSSYKKESLQGDAVLVDIYRGFGVETVFNDDASITISKTSNLKLETLNSDALGLHQDIGKANRLDLKLNKSPDIAQTIAVTCLGLGIGCELSGLHTLKIKETNRLKALKTEMEKFGAEVDITDDSLRLKNNRLPLDGVRENISIDTYNDHRMAMAFAPLALKISLTVNNAEVVSKSYPTFWDDLKSVGFYIK